MSWKFDGITAALPRKRSGAFVSGIIIYPNAVPINEDKEHFEVKKCSQIFFSVFLRGPDVVKEPGRVTWVFFSGLPELCVAHPENVICFLTESRWMFGLSNQFLIGYVYQQAPRTIGFCVVQKVTFHPVRLNLVLLASAVFSSTSSFTGMRSGGNDQ